jgi:hypothetical protein
MVAERYVHEFDAKWLRGGSPAGDALLGSGEIQSLADLANSFDMVRTMRAPRLPRMPLCASGCGTCADRAAGTDDDVPGVPPEETVRTVVMDDSIGRHMFLSGVAVPNDCSTLVPAVAPLTARPSATGR